MKAKEDLRVVKTKNNVYLALVSLLKERTFEEIKVSDICKVALINRSTFYAHFEDKYDLFSEFINDLKKSFSNELENIGDGLPVREYYLELIKVFLNHIEGKEDIYKSVVINNKNSIIMDMVYDVIENDIKNRLDANVNDIPAGIVSSFYLGAVVNVGTEWIKNGKSYSKEELYKYLEELIK